MKSKFPLIPVYLALALALPHLSASEPGKAQVAGDSLASLKIILSSEMDKREKVIRLKRKDMADSLLRLRTPADRSGFDRLITDTSVADEIRSREEFREYWKKAEAEAGIAALRSQYAAHDIDKGRIPKVYLFDSSVVIYPGWIILRRKPARPAGR